MTDELSGMLSRARDLPYGTAQIALVEQVVAQAEAAGDDERAYEARMFATQAYTYGGEPAKAFVTFSRCLSEFDQDPRPYHEYHSYELLWQFKWMVNAMTHFPEVPLARAEAVLDDMERRYRLAGHSLHAVLSHRHRVAMHIGDWVAADRLFDEWCAAPNDAMSDCRGCDPGAKVWYLARRGRDEEAVAVAAPVLGGSLGCVEQPQGILTDLLLPYLRTRRHEEAAAAHRRAYREYRGKPADLAQVGHHVAICGRTGNEARGLELVQRHLGWLDSPPSPIAAMEFAAGAALVLGRLAAAGRGDLTVYRPAGKDRPADDITVAALAGELAAQAVELAARFDARNGTPYQGERVRELLAAEPVVEYLPLSATAARPGAGGPDRSPVDEALAAVARADESGDALPAAAARVELAAAYLAAGRALEAAEAGEEAFPALPAGSRDRCRELLLDAYRALYETAPALALIDEVIHEVTDEVSDEAGRRARWQERAGALLWSAASSDEARARYAAAAAGYRDAGLVLDEVRARRLALHATRDDTGSDTDSSDEQLLAELAELDALAAALPDDPAARREAALVGYEGAEVLIDLNRLDQAVARLDPLAARLRAVDAPAEAAEAELLRGNVLRWLGRAEEAVTVLAEVAAGLPDDARRLRRYAGRLLSMALGDAGRPAEAARVRRRYGLDGDGPDS